MAQKERLHYFDNSSLDLPEMPQSRKYRLTQAVGRMGLVVAMWEGALTPHYIPCEDAQYEVRQADIKSAGSDRLSISTYNVQRGEQGISLLRSVIQDIPNDISCFQEAPRNNLKLLQETTGLPNAATNWNGRNGRTEYGNVTLTSEALPIVSSENYELPHANGHPRRTLQVTTVNHLGEEIVVWNTHLAAQNGYLAGRPNTTEREAQAFMLNAILHSEPYATKPQLGCADINVGRASSEHHLLSQDYFDITAMTAGTHVIETYPSRGAEIDYIWANEAWQGWALTVWGNTPEGLSASDHCGLTAEWTRVADRVSTSSSQLSAFRVQ